MPLTGANPARRTTSSSVMRPWFHGRCSGAARAELDHVVRLAASWPASTGWRGQRRRTGRAPCVRSPRCRRPSRAARRGRRTRPPMTAPDATWSKVKAPRRLCPSPLAPGRSRWSTTNRSDSAIHFASPRSAIPLQAAAVRARLPRQSRERHPGVAAPRRRTAQRATGVEQVAQEVALGLVERRLDPDAADDLGVVVHVSSSSTGDRSRARAPAWETCRRGPVENRLTA